MIAFRTILALSFGAALFMAVATTTRSDDPAAEVSPSKPGKAKHALPTNTPEREAAARMFVQMNHPELAMVLDQLKTDRPAEYDKAIRELFKACEQLNRTMDQNPQKYALDLEAWKVKSRIQLLVARAGLSEGDSLEAPLREALRRQQEIRVEQLAWQRDQVAQRLKKLDDQLGQVRAEGDSDVDKQFTALMRGVKKSRSQVRKPQSTNKPSPDQPSVQQDKN